VGFPTTRRGLEQAGFRFDCIGQCRGDRCRGELHWWFTPRGKRIPLNRDCSPHYTTCADKAQFRDGERGRRGGT